MIEPPMPAVQPTASPPRQRLARTLVLVGLMGAGKTSVGKRLAALLGVGFTDSDAEIVAAAGMTIPEIFATLGEPAFRDGERRVIARLLAEPPGVLATGGGAFIEPRTRAEIKRRATSVWLRADLDLLWDRVRDRPGRPLLQAPDPRAVLADLDRRRSPIYAEADVVVDSRRGASHETMARAILAAIEAYDRAATGRRPTLEPLL
jgi:shikimate kinase